VLFAYSSTDESGPLLFHVMKMTTIEGSVTYGVGRALY